jgi:hypothetical protein
LHNIPFSNSMAINFDPKYRSTWMFPRNIRDIYPWKLAKICQILNQLSLNENDWTQEEQSAILSLIETYRKKTTSSNSQHGLITKYSSQLESLGLLYKNDGSIYLTQAGESLLNFEQPLQVVQTQILNFQYPCSYSLKRKVNLNPEIKIKPFVFLLRFLKDPEIKYLDKSELVLLVISGQSADCYEFIKRKILSFRRNDTDEGSLINFIDDSITNLVNTHQTKNTPDKNKILKEIYLVANTVKDWLISSSLAFEDKATKRLFHSVEFDDIINMGIKASERIISTNISEVYFAKTYGAWKMLMPCELQEKT